MNAEEIEALSDSLEQAVPILGEAFRLACDGYPRTAKAWIKRSRKQLLEALQILDYVIAQKDKREGGDGTGAGAG